MKTNALKGMKDILPQEQRMRDFVQSKILETYKSSGFERISTPILEDSENLDKSDGGDNLNLIFKVFSVNDVCLCIEKTWFSYHVANLRIIIDITKHSHIFICLFIDFFVYCFVYGFICGLIDYFISL